MNKKSEINKVAKWLWDDESRCSNLDESFETYLVDKQCKCAPYDDYTCLYCYAKKIYKKAERMVDSNIRSVEGLKINNKEV